MEIHVAWGLGVRETGSSLNTELGRGKHWFWILSASWRQPLESKYFSNRLSLDEFLLRSLFFFSSQSLK